MLFLDGETMPTLSVTLPSLHTSQRKVSESDVRFRVLACGRRWGKTRLGAALCTVTALNGGRAWWTAPSYPMSVVGWRLIKRLALQIPGTDVNQAQRSIMFPTGGEIWVRSADNPDSLRGEGLDFAVLDECAFMKEAAWAEAIRPALSDRQGRAMFISTPKGRNWFWRLWQRCQDEGHDEWQGWQLPTSDSPYIADDEIEAARRGMPEKIFNQEYLAMFLDDAGGVFRRVMDAATAVHHEEAQPNAQYVAGVDWGRSHDFTVITVIDLATNEQVYIDRFTKIDYEVQLSRFRGMVKRFNPTACIVEDNAMGGPLVERLQSEGYPVIAWHTSRGTKERLIRNLETAFDHGEIKILPDQIQTAELQAYEQEQMSGYWRFGAPSGMHDDTVIALALAWHGASRGNTTISENPFYT